MTSEGETRLEVASMIAALDTTHGRSYEVRTFGCQMNVHDYERMSGSLEAAGYVKTQAGEVADVVVINTVLFVKMRTTACMGTWASWRISNERARGCR